MKWALALLFTLSFTPLTAFGATPVIEARFTERCALHSQQAAVRLFVDAASWKKFSEEMPDAVATTNSDWRRQSLLVFTPGIRPTPGYRLTLQANTLRRADRSLVLDVAEQAPSTDTLNAQVISQACLIMLLHKQKAWSQIEIRDANSRQVLTKFAPRR
jgi:hypothetical protein